MLDLMKYNRIHGIEDDNFNMLLYSSEFVVNGMVIPASDYIK